MHARAAVESSAVGGRALVHVGGTGRADVRRGACTGARTGRVHVRAAVEASAVGDRALVHVGCTGRARVAGRTGAADSVEGWRRTVAAVLTRRLRTGRERTGLIL